MPNQINDHRLVLLESFDNQEKKKVVDVARVNAQLSKWRKYELAHCILSALTEILQVIHMHLALQNMSRCLNVVKNYSGFPSTMKLHFTDSSTTIDVHINSISTH